MGNFETLFPNLPGQIAEIYNLLFPFTVLIAFGAVLFGSYRGMQGDLPSLGKKILMVGILAAIMTEFANMVLTLNSEISPTLVQVLEVDAVAVSGNFNEILNKISNEEGGFYDKISDPDSSVVTGLGWLGMWLTGKVAYMVMWYAYLFQKLAVYIAIAVAPIFLPLMLLDSTRSVGIRYCLGLVGIICWPVGWALGAMVTNAMINQATSTNVIVMSGGSYVYSWSLLLFVLYTSLWILFSMIGGPFIIQKAITTGTQIGTGFFAAAVGSSGSTVIASSSSAAPSSTAGSSSSGGGSVSAPAGSMSGGSYGGSSNPVAAARSIGG